MTSKLFWLAICGSPLPLLVFYVTQSWSLEQYRYFPVLFLAVGMLVGSRLAAPVRPPASWWSWGMIVLGASALVAGALLWSPWLGAVAFVMFLGAFLASQIDSEDGVSLFYLWPTTWLLVRLPLNMDYALTSNMQSGTARVSSYLLDMSDVVHRLVGNVFYLPGGPLFVESACSGVQSVFTLLFCAFLWVAWQRRSVWLLPLYAIAALVWAGFMNIVRIYVIAVAQEWFSLDLAHGWQHELLGYACLGIAIGLLISTDRLLRVVFFPVRDEDADTGKKNPLPLVWNRLFFSMSGDRLAINEKPAISGSAPTWLAAAVALLLMLLWVPQVTLAVTALTTETRQQQISRWTPPEHILDAEIPGLISNDYVASSSKQNPALGIYSHVWYCVYDGIPFRVVVSQHADVHDLCKCYSANGWTILDREALVDNPSSISTSDADEPWNAVRASFKNSEGVAGLLVFSAMDRTGVPLTTSSFDVADLFIGRFGSRENRAMRSYNGESINIQLWADSEIPLSDEQTQSLVDLHLRIREVLRSNLIHSRDSNDQAAHG